MADDKARRRSKSPSGSGSEKRQRVEEAPKQRFEDPRFTEFKNLMLPMLDEWCERARKDAERVRKAKESGEYDGESIMLGQLPKLRDVSEIDQEMLGLNQQIRMRNFASTVVNFDAPIQPLVDIFEGGPIEGFPTKLREIDELSYEEARRILSKLDTHTARTGDLWTIRETIRRWAK